MFVSALISLLVLTGSKGSVTISPAPGKVTVKKVWVTNWQGTFKCISPDGKAILVEGSTGVQAILVANGQMIVNSSYKLALNYWVPINSERVTIGRTSVNLIWSSPTIRMGFPSGSSILTEYDGKANSELGQVNLAALGFSPTYSTYSGDPDQGLLLAGCNGPETATDNSEFEILFVGRLKPTPLNLNIVYDISRPTKTLGETFPHGMSRSDANFLDYTPHPGLECGNAFTGHVYWKNKNYTEGHWLSKYVLALGPKGWSLLDGRTGRVATKSVPGLDGTSLSLYYSLYPRFLQSAGDYYISVLQQGWDVELACYRLKVNG